MAALRHYLTYGPTIGNFWLQTISAVPSEKVVGQARTDARRQFGSVVLHMRNAEIIVCSRVSRAQLAAMT